MSNVAKDLAKLIAQSTEKKVGPYDTKAVVKRVEGNTVWVAIPGGVDETPISRTIDCSKGDTVQVRVSGGTAWITGNVTDPPTSNKKAEQALNKATKAAQSAERGLTSDTIYYLASDQDSGVTVDTPGWSEEPQEITEALPYLWIYHLYTYADGHTETTEPCIVGVYGPQGDPGQDGQDGQDGTDGVSVTKVEPQYYLSTSSSSATGGSWSNSLPTYVSGRFYWTRDKITYSNGTTGYSTATYSPGLTQSVQLSYDTAQHFWMQTTGTTAVPTGAYVTEQTESAYKSNPTGGATLIRSDKVDIRVGTKTYSRFDGNGSRIYDGNGTATTNTLAEFTGSGAVFRTSGGTELGKLSSVGGGTVIDDVAMSSSGTTRTGTLSQKIDTSKSIDAEVFYSTTAGGDWYRVDITSLNTTVTDSATGRTFKLTASNKTLTLTVGGGTVLSIDISIEYSMSDPVCQLTCGTSPQSRSGSTPALIVGGGGTNAFEVTPAGNIFVSEHDTPIGTIMSDGFYDAQTSYSSEAYGAATLDLTAGVWLVTGHVRWAANATGWRRANLSQTEGSSAFGMQVNAVSGGNTTIDLVGIFKVSSALESVWLNVYHGGTNAPATLALNDIKIEAVRLL